MRGEIRHIDQTEINGGMLSRKERGMPPFVIGSEAGAAVRRKRGLERKNNNGTGIIPGGGAGR